MCKLINNLFSGDEKLDLYISFAEYGIDLTKSY